MVVEEEEEEEEEVWKRDGRYIAVEASGQQPDVAQADSGVKQRMYPCWRPVACSES